jgi:hypothetical protein
MKRMKNDPTLCELNQTSSSKCPANRISQEMLENLSSFATFISDQKLALIAD